MTQETPRRAFVTGGSGFLGIALVDLLLEQGWEVTTLEHRDLRGLDQRPVTRVKADLDDVDALAEAMRGCLALFHLASIVSFNPSDREALRQVNSAGTACVLEAAARAGVNKAVVTSSACTLGTRREPQIVDETVPCLDEWRTHNVYLDSKADQEEAAFSAQDSGLVVVVVNPTTVFGPGDWSLNSGTMIKMVKDGPVVLVPAGGTSVVDVADVASGHIAAWQRGRSGQRYVLTAENLTFSKVYETISEVLGKRPAMVKLPGFSRPFVELGASLYGVLKRMIGQTESLLTPQIVGDTYEYKWYSSLRAERELGWRPVYSLRQSVERAVEYYRREGLM